MSYTVSLDGLTVTDDITGLMWQREDDNIERDWYNAISYCDSLPLAGYTDWRLPNEFELQSIVHYGHHAPAINTAAAPTLERAEPARHLDFLTDILVFIEWERYRL